MDTPSYGLVVEGGSLVIARSPRVRFFDPRVTFAETGPLNERRASDQTPFAHATGGQD